MSVLTPAVEPAVEARDTRIARRPWLEPAAVTLYFVVLTVAMTWPWTLYMADGINPFGDVVLQMAILRWDAHALTTNPAGLFEAPFFYPYSHSIAYSEHHLGQALTALPLLLATGNPALAYNVNLLLSFVLTGVFTYLLVRDLTGSRAGALLAGTAFAFAPFRFMQTGHLHMLSTQWFPLALWALFRLARTRERRRLYLTIGAFALIMMGLSSVYYTMFMVVVLGLYAVWRVWSALRSGELRAWWAASLRDKWKLAWPYALALGVVGAVLLPVYVPYAQVNAELGLSRTTYELENWSAHWSYFGKVLGSNWLYAQHLAPGMEGVLGERQLFFGIVPGLLALAGIVWGRGRRRWFFVLLGLFSLAMTFGLSARVPGTTWEVPLPYALFYEWVPGFKALRVPVRFAALLDLSIYVLAGYGLVALLRGVGMRRSRGGQRALAVGTAVVAVGLVLLEFANPIDASNRRDMVGLIDNTEPYGWLARPENAGPIVELPMDPNQGDVHYMLFATRHLQPILNGWSGFVPPGTIHISRALAAFPDPASVALLQGLEVRHVVVHLWQFPQEQQAALKEKLDSTPELEMVHQAGDNYVYRLAPNHWLRDIAAKLAADPTKSVWIGEPRQGEMPTLDPLAYALERWGVRPEQIGGNIDVGYRALGGLPFGKYPDYAIVPNDPALSNEAIMPLGMEMDGEITANGAVRVLSQRGESGAAYYDMTGPGAPDSTIGLDMKVLDSGALTFTQRTRQYGAPGYELEEPIEGVTSFTDIGLPPWPNPAPPIVVPPGSRSVDMYFLSLTVSEVVGYKSGDPPAHSWYQLGHSREFEPGVWRYSISPLVPGQQLGFNYQSGDARLLAISTRSTEEPPEQDHMVLPLTDRLPILVTPARSSGTLDARMKIVTPQDRGDYTATIDVYAEPWGTHPEGHYGSWSVMVPGDGQAHEYAFRFDPPARTVTTERDGQPVETFAWNGPPTQGDFRAWLVLTDKQGLVARVPLYAFALDGGRVTGVQIEPESLEVVPVGEQGR